MRALPFPLGTRARTGATVGIGLVAIALGSTAVTVTDAAQLSTFGEPWIFDVGGGEYSVMFLGCCKPGVRLFWGIVGEQGGWIEQPRGIALAKVSFDGTAAVTPVQGPSQDLHLVWEKREGANLSLYYLHLSKDGRVLGEAGPLGTLPGPTSESTTLTDPSLLVGATNVTTRLQVAGPIIDAVVDFDGNIVVAPHSVEPSTSLANLSTAYRTRVPGSEDWYPTASSVASAEGATLYVWAQQATIYSSHDAYHFESYLWFQRVGPQPREPLKIFSAAEGVAPWSPWFAVGVALVVGGAAAIAAPALQARRAGRRGKEPRQRDDATRR